MATLRGLRVSLVCLLLAPVAVPGITFAGSLEEGAHEFVRALTNEAVTSLSSKDLSKLERESRFRALLRRSFDVDAIGKWVLGRYWRRATTTEQREYLGLFEDLIVKTYSRRFREYTTEKLEIDGAAKLGGDRFAVSSQLVRSKSVPPIRIEWRVSQPAGRYLVTDIVVEGVSLAQTTRSEFSSVIRSRGGKMSGLIAALRDKNVTLDRTTN